jgi:hypothetical protein
MTARTKLFMDFQCQKHRVAMLQWKKAENAVGQAANVYHKPELRIMFRSAADMCPGKIPLAWQIPVVPTASREAPLGQNGWHPVALA